MRFTYIVYYSSHGTQEGDLCIVDKFYSIEMFTTFLKTKIHSEKMSLQKEIFNFDFVIILDSCYSGHWVNEIEKIKEFEDFPLLVLLSSLSSETCKTLQFTSYITTEKSHDYPGLHFSTAAYKGSFKGIGTKVL